ncbi:MAG: phenylalanine--tRNA ligase subunit beta, partial [Streptosporangiales bacterium]|nr:phenylalanine--tRNA ligase subunit beta [Streptosporangiales bacterium]
MRVPLSWLREHVDVPAETTGRELGEALVPLGMELEGVEEYGDGVRGPLVAGRVLAIEELTEFKKPIRWCRVDVGEHNGDPAGMPGVTAESGASRGVICGARNFAAGDLVVVALPGAMLPGGFEITARKTYGHVSDGMICSARELGIGDDHSGIIVLPADFAPVGGDVTGLLQVHDTVLDLEITPDNGHLESVRGMAREASYVTGGAYRDPADTVKVPEPDEARGWPATIEDISGCDRFSLMPVTGIDPQRQAPLWLRTRLYRAGVRSVSLAVDVTNYVMLELGQPMHAYDPAKLSGRIVVRRAREGEAITTLDHVRRTLTADDLVVADDDGAVGIAGVMGDLRSEISETTTDVLLEAAHWNASSISRTLRHHKLPSEASRRFERGVDPEMAAPALQRAAEMLAEYGGGEVGALSVTGVPYEPPTVTLAADLPARIIGLPVDTATVVERLELLGCTASVDGGTLTVVPPTWRPDLRDPADIVEEVARLGGYEHIPEIVPTPPPGRGLTERQRWRRRVGRALAYAGYVEAVSFPFVGEADWDALGLPADDPRRAALRLLNPLSDEQPLLRTTLLPGLLRGLRRNVGRGLTDVALFETGLVFRPGPDAPGDAPLLRVDARPDDADLAAAEAVLPRQPERAAVVLAGEYDRGGWWGAGRPAEWGDAVEAVRTIAAETGVEVTVTADEHAP